MHIDLQNDNFVQYDGASPEEVFKKYNEHHSSWSVSLFSWKQKNIKLNPFNQSCVGIDSREKYNVSLNVIRMFFFLFEEFSLSCFIFFRYRLLEGFFSYFWNSIIFVC